MVNTNITNMFVHVNDYPILTTDWGFLKLVCFRSAIAYLPGCFFSVPDLLLGYWVICYRFTLVSYAPNIVYSYYSVDAFEPLI